MTKSTESFPTDVRIHLAWAIRLIMGRAAVVADTDPSDNRQLIFAANAIRVAVRLHAECRDSFADKYCYFAAALRINWRRSMLSRGVDRPLIPSANTRCADTNCVCCERPKQLQLILTFAKHSADLWRPRCSADAKFDFDLLLLAVAALDALQRASPDNDDDMQPQGLEFGHSTTSDMVGRAAAVHSRIVYCCVRVGNCNADVLVECNFPMQNYLFRPNAFGA